MLKRIMLILCCFMSLSVWAEQVQVQQLSIQGISRQYLLFNPQHLKAAPLIIVLHGGGGNATRMLQHWQMLAQREGLIIAAPNAQQATWNATGCCGNAQQQQTADAAFI